MFNFHRRNRRRRRYSQCLEPMEGRQLLSTVAAVTAGISPVTGPASTIVLHETRNVSFTANLGRFVTIAPAGNLQANISWGDGTNSPGKVIPVGPVGVDQIRFEVDGMHKYTFVGTFPIHVAVFRLGPTPTSPVVLVATLNDTAIVARGNVNLTGKITGHYLAAPTSMDVGATYLFSGTGAAADMGPVSAKGSLTIPGLIASGKATGVLTLTTISTSPVAGGTVNLKLSGPLQAGFGNIPSTLTYTISGGTGQFAGATGAGKILVTVGAGNTFTFLITSALPTAV